jgi:hypothetical protein
MTGVTSGAGTTYPSIAPEFILGFECIIKPVMHEKRFEDTKEVIRSRKSKKDRQYNGKKKRQKDKQ